MGVLGWVMLSLAMWHFTIWLPDRFWGGIVGALVGAIAGSVAVGFIIYGARTGSIAIPGQRATDIAVVLYGVPGALLGMLGMYVAGLRRDAPAGWDE